MTTTVSGSAISTATGTFSSTLGVTGVATLGNGAILGTPASGTVTNLTGTASININGTVGATTPTTVVATTVQASTTMGVGAATPSTSGAGITFPATQNASSNANTLDDYEEGTYTPVMTFGGGSVGQSVAGATGWYTKVGRLVNFHYYLQLSNKGTSTGNAVITGLPFNMDAYGGASLGYVFGITYTGTLAPLVDGTSIYMYKSSSGNASAAITETAFDTSFRMDLNYTVNVV